MSDPWTNESLITPLSLGLISDPPTLVLLYDLTQGSSNNNAPEPDPQLADLNLTLDASSRDVPQKLNKKVKRRKRVMPLRNFSDRTDVGKFVTTFIERHKEFLQDVPKVTLEKMMKVIQEIQKGLSVDDAVLKVDKEYDGGGGGVNSEDEDLNKLSDDELIRRKDLMEVTYLKNKLKPGDPGYVYDKEVDFGNSVRSPSEWDNENSEDEEGSLNKEVIHDPESPKEASNTQIETNDQELEEDKKPSSSPGPRPESLTFTLEKSKSAEDAHSDSSGSSEDDDFFKLPGFNEEKEKRSVFQPWTTTSKNMSKPNPVTKDTNDADGGGSALSQSEEDEDIPSKLDDDFW